MRVQLEVLILLDMTTQHFGEDFPLHLLSLSVILREDIQEQGLTLGDVDIE